ncbi:hypothetical protein LTR95_012729 [Oleoguttula sp. CCFEE 5521]
MQSIDLDPTDVIPSSASSDVRAGVPVLKPIEIAQSRRSLAETPAVVKATGDFLLVVSRFRASSEGKKLGCAPTNEATRPETRQWSQVIEALETSEQAYLGKNRQSHTAKTKTRAWLRKFSRLEGTINSWIRLLPSESWQGSLLAGGLKAAVRLQNMREMINKAIQQMELSIDIAERQNNIYSENIEKFASSVVVGCLEVMQACIEYFRCGSVKRAFGAVIHGKDYRRDLSEKIDDLKITQNDMERVASVIFQERESKARDAASDSRLQAGGRNSTKSTLIETALGELVAPQPLPPDNAQPSEMDSVTRARAQRAGGDTTSISSAPALLDASKPLSPQNGQSNEMDSITHARAQGQGGETTSRSITPAQLELDATPELSPTKYSSPHPSRTSTSAISVQESRRSSLPTIVVSPGQIPLEQFDSQDLRSGTRSPRSMAPPMKAKPNGSAGRLVSTLAEVSSEPARTIATMMKALLEEVQQRSDPEPENGLRLTEEHGRWQVLQQERRQAETEENGRAIALRGTSAG